MGSGSTFGSAGLRLIGLAVLVALLSLAVACVRQDPETVEGVIEFLRDNGYTVGERSDKEVVYIWAVDAAGVDVNGHHLLIYEFAAEKGADRGLEATEKILQSGTGFWSFDRETAPVPYFAKGKVLLFLGDHPDAEKIRDLVESSLPSLLDLVRTNRSGDSGVLSGAG